MKILFITHHYLHGNGGSVYATRAYINAFAEFADEITLLFPMKAGTEPLSLHHKVKAWPIWDKRSNIRKGLELLIGHMHRYGHIEKIIGNNQYDMVVFDTSIVTYGLIDWFKKKGTKVITIHHNYQYEYFRDNIKGLLRFPTLFWSKIYECEAVRKSDINLTLTNDDKQLLKEHYGNGQENIEVLGTFEYCQNEHKIFPEVKEPIFLITGSLSAVQSENSLLPWMDNYYPILKDVFPEATLTLAGKSPSTKLLEKAQQHGITVIPSPDSMQPILAKAKYYICPTSLGGGLKLRVMDGLSAGLPVVCHAVSARGYEAFIDKGLLLVYGNPTSFREQLEKLKYLTINKQDAIALYESIFSFDAGQQRLKKLLTLYHYS